jgi:hypothetical protein
VFASGASAKREAIADVRETSSSPSSHPDVVAALYEADQKAHEEAVQNGGVRLALSFFRPGI